MSDRISRGLAGGALRVPGRPRGLLAAAAVVLALPLGWPAAASAPVAAEQVTAPAPAFESGHAGVVEQWDDDSPSVRTAGSCEWTAVGLEADAAGVRPLVPAELTLAAVGDTTPLVVFAETCEQAVGDDPPRSMFVGGVFVFVSHPHGDGVFDLTPWVVSDRVWVKRYRRLGFGDLVQHVPSARHRAGPSAAGLWHTVAEVNGGTAPFSFTATTSATTAPLPIPLESIHWHASRQGLVRCTYPHGITTAGAGTGVLWPGPGGLLAELVGEGPHTVAAASATFAFTGTCDIPG